MYMAIHYEIIRWGDLTVAQYRDLSASHSSCDDGAVTIAEAASCIGGRPKDYIVAVEDGIRRQLTEAEENELKSELSRQRVIQRHG
jgi:hypothetical protein